MSSPQVAPVPRKREITHRFADPYRPPLDLMRVARAVFLPVEPLGNDTYRVYSRQNVYYVRLSPYFSCDCGDAIFRESICKHQIAALYHEGDAETVALVAELRRAWRARKAAQLKETSVLPAPAHSVPEPTGHMESQESAPSVERVVLGRWWE